MAVIYGRFYWLDDFLKSDYRSLNYCIHPWWIRFHIKWNHLVGYISPRDFFKAKCRKKNVASMITHVWFTTLKIAEMTCHLSCRVHESKCMVKVKSNVNFWIIFKEKLNLWCFPKYAGNHSGNSFKNMSHATII